MQRRKAQFADILPVEVTGETVVGRLCTRYPAQCGQAYPVIQSVRRAVIAHRIGYGTVTLAAQLPEQRHHTRRIIHR